MSSVLIIENNDFFRRSFKEVIRMYIPSIAINELSDGSEVHKRIKETNPDIIFMDIRLPGKNGLELTREIKNSHPDVVVSIFTSYDLPEYRTTAERYGADHYLLKDAMTGAEIAAMIKAVISRKKGGTGKPETDMEREPV